MYSYDLTFCIMFLRHAYKVFLVTNVAQLVVHLSENHGLDAHFDTLTVPA